MNYTLDISSELNEYNRKIKKLQSSYGSSYSKTDVVDKVQALKTDLGLSSVDIEKSNTFIRFNLKNSEDVKCVEVKATPVSKTEKVVVKFAEHKYFKNLKYLFGAYKTEYNQEEGSSDLTKEAYIRSIIGANFHATDLSPSDKFVSVEEVDLRSPYLEALNNVIFESTRDLEGEIYGINDDGELYVCGKRTTAFQRLYDNKLISSIDDIVPAVIVNNTVVKAVDDNAVDFRDGEYEKPKYMNINVKKPMNDTYDVGNDPSFKYFKNLLVFEAKLNLASPRLVEKSDFDNGEFQLVCNALAQGDEIISGIALDGNGTKTHTILTNVKKKCRYLAAQGDDLVAIMADGMVYTAKNINFESAKSIDMQTDGKEFSVEGAQLIDMIYDDVEGWIGTFGYEETQGEDFYGDKYYRFMISKSLNSVTQAGSEAASMYASPFEIDENPIALTFAARSDDNLIMSPVTTRLEVVDTYGGVFGTPETSYVSPKDIAIKSYTETDVTGGAYNDLADVGPIITTDDNKEILQNILEGPYVVNPSEYEKDGSKMYQKIFSDGDMDIVLQQDYIFIKTKLYTVDENGDYERTMTRGKHWLGAKLPITLDTTMLKLRSMPVNGTTSCYNFILDEIKTFCSWALDTAQIEEIGDKYTFTNLSLEDSFTEDELNCYKNAIKPLSENYKGSATEGRGLLTYAQFLSLGVTYYSGNKKLDVTNDSFAVAPEAIDKVVFETGLPLTNDLKVDDTARFQLVGTKDNNIIIISKEYANAIDFEEAYRLYLLHAFTYVRGIREYDAFGAKVVTNIYSFGSKIYFRCYTGDMFFIDKKYLHKAEDIETVSNWRVSQQPGLSHINGWDVEDLKNISGYETVTLKDGKLFPINSKEHAVYFFKLTSPLFTLPDNQHMFFGGYAFPSKTIYDKYASMGGGQFDKTQDWWKINLENWIAADESSGKTPVVVYSNDGGATFNMLPVRKYLPENFFNDGIDRQVAYFTETEDGKVAGFVKENDNGAESYTTNQIIIDFDDFNKVDSTATKWEQVGIPRDGEVRSFNNDAGKITYTTGRLGFGVDVDVSQMLGSDTFNFDFTGNNTLVIPDGLKVAKVESGNAIKFNKAITDEVTTGTYRVLLAAYTKADIPFQEDYLSKDSSILSDYLRSNGALKVESVKAVTNALTANRAYFENFPTIQEDTSKTYYEYDGDEVVELKNNYNERIIKCTEDGENFAFSNSKDSNGNPIESFIDFASSLGNGLQASQLVAQGKPANTLKEFLSNAECMEDDTEFTSLVKGTKSYTYMKEFDEASVLAMFDVNTALATLLEKEGIIEDTEDTSKYDSVVKFVETMEDQFGGPDNNFADAAARFVFKEVGSKKYLYDNKYQVFVLKSRRFIRGTLSIPYTFYNGGNGMTVIPNPLIEYSKETGNMIKAGALASGIYYHPMGYGGLRNNTSITKTTPWKRDPAAFTDDYLKNSVGDYVFLTDNVGSRIRTYDAIQLIEDGSYDITYDSFLNDGANEVTVKSGDIETTHNYYKLHKTGIKQYHSCDYVRKDSKVLLRFYKNAQRITDFELVENYLYNYNGERCYKAEIDWSGFLIVGDCIGTPSSTVTAKFKVHYTANGVAFTDEVESTFIVNGSNSVPWVNTVEGDDTTVVYYKGYGLISKPDEGSITNTKTVSYKLTLNDADNSFNYEGADIKTTECSCSVEDNKLVITFVAGNDFIERSVSVNGTTVWKAAIIQLDCEITKQVVTLSKKDGDVDTRTDFYFGDMLASDNIIIPSDLITSQDGTLLYLGYKEHNTVPENSIVTGAYGYSISKKPKYSTFQNLLYGEGVMINKGITYDESVLTSIKVSSTAEDNSEIKLNAPITFNEAYNDGIEHYFKFKILTVSEQSLAPKHMNDESYYYELSKEQMSLYTPNRVWYNPKGSPVPPIKVGSKIFNSENNYAYYDEDYRNSNDINIYMCDEEGHYVNFDENGVEYRLDSKVDGTYTGDCSANVYMGVDNRYVSPKPINPTCQDWYYENIYTPNNEVNPLWQIIHISPKIENKKWVQKVNICRYKKSGASQLLVDDVEHPYVSMNELNQIIAEDGNLRVKENFLNFNADDGDIELLLSEGDEHYKNLINSNDGDMTLYGLNFSVNKLKNMFNNDRSELSATLQASYSVNTLRDFTTNVQDGSTIAKITEMGIFDKNHKLIAYAQFPPIEYRTEKQHTAFTAVIYHGNMTGN